MAARRKYAFMVAGLTVFFFISGMMGMHAEFIPTDNGTRKQTAHASPDLSGSGKCSNFPTVLSAKSRPEFSVPRKLGGLNIYFL
jgi:hypothetical protein